MLLNTTTNTIILNTYSLYNTFHFLKLNMQNNTNTIPKNTILNWLYSTDMHVSLEKLGAMLENQTNGRYKLVNTGNNESNNKSDKSNPLPSSFANKNEEKEITQIAPISESHK